MILSLTPLERLHNLEAKVLGLDQALTDILNSQQKILANDQKLFEIHEHNDGYLKTVHDTNLQVIEELKEMRDGAAKKPST